MKPRSLIYSLIIFIVILSASIPTTSCSDGKRTDVRPKKLAKLSITTKKIVPSKDPSTGFGGRPILAFDANKDEIDDLLCKDPQGSFFLLKGDATKFSVVDKADIFEPEDVGSSHFVAHKLFNPDKQHRYILASSNKKLVLLDVVNMKFKEIFSDTKTTVSLSGMCVDLAVFGSDIDGDGREELVNDTVIYEWNGESFNQSYTLPHRGVHTNETAFSDIDGDGSDEVIANDREHGGEQLKVSKLRNGVWAEIPVATDETQTNEIYALGDIDGDGTDEVATVVTDEDAVRLVIYSYHNDKLAKIYSGRFTKPWRNRQTPERIQSVSYCDINDDGKDEVLMTTEDLIRDPLKPGYDVNYRYMLLAWKNDKLVKLTEGSIIYPQVITGRSSFLIVNTIPDKGEKLRNIDKIYEQVTEITYR